VDFNTCSGEKSNISRKQKKPEMRLWVRRLARDREPQQLHSPPHQSTLISTEMKQRDGERKRKKNTGG
jgi:hypothetical protein